MIRGIMKAFEEPGKGRICTYQFREFERPKQLTGGIAVKYVRKGNAFLDVEQTGYRVDQGEFLLVDQGSRNGSWLEAKQVNEGLCIFVDERVTGDVLFHFLRDEARMLDYPQDYLSISLEITEGIYSATHSSLGHCFSRLAAAASDSGRLDGFGEEQFYRLAEELVMHQMDVHLKVMRVPAKQLAVKKEIFRRMEVARAYLHDNISGTVSIEAVAQLSGMSPYHFMRSFKRVYGLSPYQYLIEQRLKLAGELLLNKNLAVTEISSLCGFNDIYTFSKAFRKKYGCAPTSYKNNDPSNNCYES